MQDPSLTVRWRHVQYALVRAEWRCSASAHLRGLDHKWANVAFSIYTATIFFFLLITILNIIQQQQQLCGRSTPVSSFCIMTPGQLLNNMVCNKNAIFKPLLCWFLHPTTQWHDSFCLLCSPLLFPFSSFSFIWPPATPYIHRHVDTKRVY